MVVAALDSSDPLAVVDAIVVFFFSFVLCVVVVVAITLDAGVDPINSCILCLLEVL